MATLTRPRATVTARPRRPSPEEAALLDVYLDAERALLDTVTGEVSDVAALADAGRPTATREATGARRVRAQVARTVARLDRGASRAIQGVIGAAAEQGADEAARQLRAITGTAPGGDAVNRDALARLAVATVDRTSVAHQAILRAVPDAYRQVIGRVTAGVLVGAHSPVDAAQRAMWALADRGVTSFTDSAGRRWRLSSYVDMAVRTAAARAHVDAQLDRLADGGVDLVIVSDAPRECDRCKPWEGAVLRRGAGPTGRVPMEHAITGDEIVVDVAGTVDEARAAGLLHPNCRHSLSAYRPGVTAPMPIRRDPGGYEPTQRQRAIERHIREWKEREAAALTPEHKRAAAVKVRGWQGAMREHLREYPDLRRNTRREGVDVGIAPTAALRARLDAPLGAAVTGTARAPRDMLVAELARELRAARAAGNTGRVERLLAEQARRERARATRRARRGT